MPVPLRFGVWTWEKPSPQNRSDQWFPGVAQRFQFTISNLLIYPSRDATSFTIVNPAPFCHCPVSWSCRCESESSWILTLLSWVFPKVPTRKLAFPGPSLETCLSSVSTQSRDGISMRRDLHEDGRCMWGLRGYFHHLSSACQLEEVGFYLWWKWLN